MQMISTSIDLYDLQQELSSMTSLVDQIKEIIVDCETSLKEISENDLLRTSQYAWNDLDKKMIARSTYYAHEIREIARLFKLQAKQPKHETCEYLHIGERKRLQTICQQGIALFAEECVPEKKRYHAKLSADVKTLIKCHLTLDKIYTKLKVQENHEFHSLVSEKFDEFFKNVSIEN